MKRDWSVVIFLLILMLSLGAGLSAQTYQGQITGVVTDSSGAVISHGSVTVLNVGKGVALQLKTNEVGEYNAPNLEPGVYRVTIEAAGFSKAIKEIRVEVARSLRLNFTLAPGVAKETVAVTEEAPVVNTSTSVLEGTFTNQAIAQLPLQGRDIQNLVVLRPGIMRTAGGGFLSIASNGNRFEDNNFILDGIDDNDAYYGDTVMNAAGVQGTPSSHLPIDAIQEFNIQQSPESDYGWKPGAIVNVGIKSGTNNLHGTAYYFGRNNALDARNFFNPVGEQMSPLRLHQFGASLGGPIKKDKLFYFVNYEGVRDVVGNPVVKNTPLTISATTLGMSADPGRSIPDAIAACSPGGQYAALGPCNPLSLKIASIYPTNTGVHGTADPVAMPFDMGNTNREDNGIVKVDYHFNDKHSFSGRYFIGDSFQNEEDYNVLLPEFMSIANSRAQVGGATWSWVIKPNLVNQLRFGYNSFWQAITTGDAAFPSSHWGIDTGVTNPVDYGFPRIGLGSTSTYTDAGGNSITAPSFNVLGGNSSWPLYTTPNRTWQITDALSWTVGKHNLKIGGEFRTGSTDNVRDTYGRGRIDFSSYRTRLVSGGPRVRVPALEAFMLGQWSSARIHVGDTHREVSQKSFGLYVQDDFRVTRRLTLNAGLRYDLSLPITEANDQLANFIPGVGLVQVGHGIDSPYNTDKNNFAPRLGFAYDLFGNGKTVLRGGAGIIYELPNMSLFIGQNGADAAGLATIPTGALGPDGKPLVAGGTIQSAVIYPGSINWNTTGGPVFGSLATTATACTGSVDDPAGASPCPILGVDRNIKTPYVMNWNLNLQHAFTDKLALQVAYVGNRGVKLYSLRDINQVNYFKDVFVTADCPDCYEKAVADVADDGLSGRPMFQQFPYLSAVDMLENKDHSIYHGLQTTLTQRPFKGLDFVLGYTWSHAIDMGSSNRPYLWADAYNPGLEIGDADSDIRHRVTLAMTYEVPKMFGSKALNSLFGNWHFNNIVTLETGRPRDLFDSYNWFSGTESGNDRWNFYGDAQDLQRWSLMGADQLKYWVKAGIDSDTGLQYGDAKCIAFANAQGTIGTLNYAGGCYDINGTIILPPGWGSPGTMHRNMGRRPAFTNWDVGLGKTFAVNERMSLQFRGEVFNVLNHPNFARGGGDLSDPGTLFVPRYTPDVQASNPVVGSGGSRHIQLGLKLIW